MRTSHYVAKLQRMKTLSVKIPHDTNQALSALARRHGIAKSRLIREACQEYFTKQPEHAETSLLERIGDIAGSLNGPGNLTTTPEYLHRHGD